MALREADLDSMVGKKMKVKKYQPATALVDNNNTTVAANIVNGDGKVEISIEEFLKLLQLEKQKPIIPPANYFISKATYVGVAREHCIHLKCSFEIAVLVSVWTKIKLLPDGVGLSSHSIKLRSSENNNNEDSSVAQARIGVMDDGYFLISSEKAEYVVDMEVLVPYQSVRKSGMQMWVPRAAENIISFKVGLGGVQIKVDPSFASDSHIQFTILLLIIDQIDSKLHEEGEGAEKKKDETNVSVVFPPTNTLNVNWTVIVDEGPSTTKDAPQQKMMITAEHNTMCSVGEGVVVLNSIFSYSIVHGSIAAFEIVIPDDLHVLGVEGNGIKKWEVVGGKDKTALIVLDTDTKPSYRCLRVVLDYGIENSYHMTVISELSMTGTSADVIIPSFKCLGEEINREKGYLAIEARTNVEIAELKREYLALVDTSELPQPLWKLAGGAILMGYKFLGAGYSLELRVKKHEDVGVLIAACDDAHFITTCSEEGKVLHKLILRIRNSQKQYVRIKIPTEHDLWSASVAGVPVKPAMDEEGMVMIQLQKSSGKKTESNNVFVVELVYIEREVRPMGKSGTFAIGLAQLDIPINYLFVSVHLPRDFDYTSFEGSLKEVLNFTKYPPTSVAYAQPVEEIASQTNMISRRSSIVLSNVNMDRMKEVSSKSAWGKGGYQTKGVLPVKVEMPVSGQEFKFEQLIVMGSNIGLSTTYTKKNNASYGHRRTRSWWNCCC